MNKRMMSIIITAALVVPSLACAFEQKQDGITLKVTDYARKIDSVLGHTPDGALTAEKFLTKSIHPIRITIKNDTDKPIMISGRSILRLKMISPEEGVQLLHQHNLLGVPAWGHKLGYYAIGALFGKYVFDLISINVKGIPVFSVVGLICLSKCSSDLANKEEVLTKFFKDLTAQEELRYPEVIQPGKKISKLLLIDERMNKKRMIEFVVFEKNEETITKFEIKLT